MNTINGKWLYLKLRVAGHFTIKVRLYDDWIRTNSTLTGFLCEIVGEKSDAKFEKINKFIEDHQLPVYIEDFPNHSKEFKIKIIK